MGTELVCFDWSGVISDDRIPVHYAANRLLEHFGLPPITYHEWLPRARASARDFLGDYGIDPGPGEVRRLFKKYFDEALENGLKTSVYPDVLKTFQHMKRRGDIIVVSKHASDNLHQEARDYGLAPYISSLRGDVPDKAHELVTMSEIFGVRPSCMMYVGDTADDVQHAKIAGVVSVAISGPPGKQRGYHSREQLERAEPDLLIETLFELREHFPG